MIGPYSVYYIEGGTALSGSIQTQYFGEGFNASKMFLPSFAVNLWISIPDRHRLKQKENLGIYVEVEKNSLSRRFNDKLDAVGPVIDKKLHTYWTTSETYYHNL